MFVFTLESLVLRGVTVKCDGSALNVRLGTSVEATDLRPTAIGNSMCHPLSDYRPDTNPADGANRPVSSPAAKLEVGGAGRSHSAGVLRRFVPASSFGAPAAGLFAGRQGKRSEERSLWHMPAGRTPPTKTCGTRSR